MATTVGGTLASSKLAVTQDDLHLAGASADQLTVQFNQLAFNDLLASDRKGPYNRRRSEDRQPATGEVAPPSSVKSVPPPDHGPIPDSAHQLATKNGIPWGALSRRRQQPQKPNRRPEPLTRDGQLPRGFHSPRATRIWRARTSADRERPLNKWLTPAARTLQETEIEPLYKILLHNRKLRPLARPPPAHLTRHPKYCAYHQLVGHPTSKCRSLRERLEGFIRQGVVAIAPHGESTNANATSRRRGSPRSPMKALSLPDSGQAGATWSLPAQSTTLHTPVSSTLLTDKEIENAQGILFEVPANRPDQKPIIFGRYQREDFPRPRERDEQGEPDYSWVSPKVAGIMERWGYHFEDKEGLN